MNPVLVPIFERRSIREYTAKDLSEESIHDLLAAAMAAPSACCKDPWEFLVVRDAGTLREIAAGLPNGGLLAEAAAGIVVCGDLRRAHDGQLSYLLQDCSAAIENILLAASLLGIGACWLGVHPREERVKHIRQLMVVPEVVIPIAVVALGWPADSKEPRTRYHAEFVHHERW